MFTRYKDFKPFLSLFLSICLVVSLTACSELTAQLPPQWAGLLGSLMGDSQSPPAEIPEGSSFAVHYIDVGQADCALVVCDGHYMLIDGGNAEDSDLVYAYLRSNGVEHLDYMVASHPHEDHIGGLSGAVYAASVDTALSPTTKGDTQVFEALVSSLSRQGKSLTVPEAGDTFSLGSAQVEILGPVKDYEEVNDTSIVLSVDYGNTTFLFTGDMESPAETDLVEGGADLSATVLKVGHHGSASSSSYRFLREVMPTYAVISVGADNSYGHPTEEVLSRLEDAGTQIYRTDLHGTVIAESDGDTVTFRTEKGVSVAPAEGVPDSYIGNSNSKKLHTADCPSVEDISAQNRVAFENRAEAISAGYEPCGRCKP